MSLLKWLFEIGAVYTSSANVHPCIFADGEFVLHDRKVEIFKKTYYSVIY